jgi:PAS domain S-box-containing protein
MRLNSPRTIGVLFVLPVLAALLTLAGVTVASRTTGDADRLAHLLVQHAAAVDRLARDARLAPNAFALLRDSLRADVTGVDDGLRLVEARVSASGGMPFGCSPELRQVLRDERTRWVTVREELGILLSAKSDASTVLPRLEAMSPNLTALGSATARLQLLADMRAGTLRHATNIGLLALFCMVALIVVLGLRLVRGFMRERDAREEELQRLSLVASRAASGILLTSPSGQVTWVNQSFEQITEYTAAEFMGKRPGEVLTGPDTDPNALDDLRRQLKAGHTGRQEVLNYTKSGRPIWMEVEITPVLDANGKVTQYVSIENDVTARHEAAKALADREEMFRIALESMRDGLVLFGDDATVRLLNASAERILEVGAPDLSAYDDGGSGWRMLCPDGTTMKNDERPTLLALTSGQPQRDIFMGVHRRDGAVRWLRTNAMPLKRAGEEKPYAVLTTFEDVTERREAEERIRRLTRVVEQMPAAAIVTDAQGRIEWVNAGFTRITGYMHEEVHGQTPSAVKSGLTPVAAYAELWDTVMAGREWRGELLNRRKSGELYWASVSIFPVRDEHGCVVNFVGIQEDISARKQTEEALRQSEEKHRTILGHIEDGYYEVSLEGRLTFVNEPVTRLLGRPGEDVTGTHFADFTGPRDCRRLRAACARVHATGQPIPAFDWSITDARGQAWQVEASISVITGPEGLATGFRGIVRDVTPRMQVEKDLRAAREAALETARIKSEFLANMSHEIRTPMNGVIGMTDLLLETNLTLEQRDYVLTTKSSADALLTVINDILDFSKIEAGKLTIESVAFRPRELLADSLKALAFRASDKGLELALDVPADLPESLTGDPARLRQVVTNLVGNAIKFTAQGEVVVSAQVVDSDASTCTLRVCVRDTGIGVPLDKQALIFEAFTQADGSTTRRFGGTGLGLSISTRLVQLMGGTLGVESEPGRGSSFYFTARFGLVASLPSTQAPTRGGVLGGCRALIVDDNATNRRIASGLLALWDMKAAVAENTADAEALLDRARVAGEPFQVMLLDVQMPDEDGLSFAGRLLREPRFDGLPIIMLTSAGVRGDVERCRDMGVAGYLVKPVGQTDLREALVSVLGGSREAPRDVVTTHSLRENRRTLRILVADDQPVNCKVAVRMLEKQGHTVHAVPDGREALAAVTTMPFDLVLMDVQMPEMNGLEATAAIRALERERGGHIPIIALTAHAMKGDMERCLEAGMDAYVSKPISPSKLFEAIDLLTGSAGVPPAASGARETRRRDASPSSRPGLAARPGSRETDAA